MFTMWNKTSFFFFHALKKRKMTTTRFLGPCWRTFEQRFWLKEYIFIENGSAVLLHHGVLNGMVHEWGNLFFWTYGPWGREGLSLLLRMFLCFLCQEYNKSYILSACSGQGPYRKRQGNLISKSFWTLLLNKKPKKVDKHPVSLFVRTKGTLSFFFSVSNLNHFIVLLQWF